MKQYLDMLRHIKANGVQKGDRTGTGTLSCFGYQNRYDLSEGFPIVTTKRVLFRAIVEELLWFIKGDTNIKYLVDRNVNIWVPDAYREYKKYTLPTANPLTENEFKEKILTDNGFAEIYGDLGPVYGEQWRSWEGIDGNKVDQLKQAIEAIKTNPDSRRIIVSAWNVGQIPDMALPPCHTIFQFYVSNNRLSCQLYQRSADAFLGVPFNISSYALLVNMVAFECGLEVGEFIHTFGDFHIYNNHLEQVDLQLTREPFPLPKLVIKDRGQSFFDITIDDIELVDYVSHSTIKGLVSV